MHVEFLRFYDLYSLCENLIARGFQGLEIDEPAGGVAFNGPPPAVLVVEEVGPVGAGVDAADEDGLARELAYGAAVGEPGFVFIARNEGLEGLHVRAPCHLELGEFDEPLALHLLNRVLVVRVEREVRGPWAAEDLADGGLTYALEPLEDEHAVELAAGRKDPLHGGAEGFPRACAREVALLDAHVVRQPRVEARLAVPLQGVEVRANGVEVVVRGDVGHGLLDVGDGHLEAVLHRQVALEQLQVGVRDAHHPRHAPPMPRRGLAELDTARELVVAEDPEHARLGVAQERQEILEALDEATAFTRHP